MVAAIVEKASFAIAIPVLYAQGRVPVRWLGFASMGAVWGILFVVAFGVTPKGHGPDSR